MHVQHCNDKLATPGSHRSAVPHIFMLHFFTTAHYKTYKSLFFSSLRSHLVLRTKAVLCNSAFFNTERKLIFIFIPKVPNQSVLKKNKSQRLFEIKIWTIYPRSVKEILLCFHWPVLDIETRAKFYFYFIFSLCPLDANPVGQNQTKFYAVSLNCSIKLNCFVSILCSIWNCHLQTSGQLLAGSQRLTSKFYMFKKVFGCLWKSSPSRETGALG